MILKKPYAFLIKHFRLIHLIITALFKRIYTFLKFQTFKKNILTRRRQFDIFIKRIERNKWAWYAGVAQQAEQLTCNQ